MILSRSIASFPPFNQQMELRDKLKNGKQNRFILSKIAHLSQLSLLYFSSFISFSFFLMLPQNENAKQFLNKFFRLKCNASLRIHVTGNATKNRLYRRRCGGVRVVIKLEHILHKVIRLTSCVFNFKSLLSQQASHKTLNVL